MSKPQILITSGIGTSLTELAAFDAALVQCGVHNFNLLALSSVIPPTHEIKQIKGSINIGSSNNWGDRLYVVMAEARTSQKDQEVWAGIGWIQDEITGEGLFVEHHGHSEGEVKRLIDDSLAGLAANRSRKFGPINTEIVGAVCDGTPLSVIAVAAYQISDWENKPFTF